MSGSKLNFNGSSSITITELITVLGAERTGFTAVSLTNMSTTAVPAISAGSYAEIAGSIYRFSTEEPISTTNVTSTANCNWTIELVPSSSIVTARFSTVTKTWRDDYQFWYESTSLIYKCVGEIFYYSGSYINKKLYSHKNTQYLNDYYTPIIRSTNVYQYSLSTPIYLTGGPLTTGNNYTDLPSEYGCYNSIVTSFQVVENLSTSCSWLRSYTDMLSGSTSYTAFAGMDSTRINIQVISTYHVGHYYKILITKVSS
jgi:hypothetical protein